MATTTESAQERQVREEQEAHERDELAKRRGGKAGTAEGTETGADSAQAQEPSGDEPPPEGDTPADTQEPPEGHLIDPQEYETEALALPKIDGEGVDKLRAKFAGSVLLNRSDERDVALIRDTKLGSRITLMVECEVGPPVPDYTTNRDGDLDALVLGRTFKVESVYRAVVPDE